MLELFCIVVVLTDCFFLIACCQPHAEGDSKNYLTYYKRAAVFLAMGKSKSALPDLTRAIELKPDFLAVSLLGNFCSKR